MASERGKYTYVAGVGWTAKSKKEAANYNNLGEGWIFVLAVMRWFPDFIQDALRKPDADYTLAVIQRVFMRAKARYQYVDITACRGATKSFCSFNEEMDEMLTWPGQQVGYVGPSLKQTAKIASQTYHQIEKDHPGLCDHFTVDAESGDRFEISTGFASKLSVAAYRGNNLHKATAEESAQENGTKFDHSEYGQVVLPSVRLQYRVAGTPSKAYVRFKQHSITSAGRRQNEAYETRCAHMQMMQRGESAFVIDVPYGVILLSQMRPVDWATGLRNELTPDEWLREMESRYTGADENPLISDRAITESRELVLAEFSHCCKDRDNQIAPRDVIYILGYDVSYADGANNAKCAVCVLKCTKQNDFYRRDKYLKQVVNVDDWPPGNSMEQARRLKALWYKFCYDDSKTYIAIDAWQYGTSVVQALMQDLGDGLAPLSIYNHTLYTEYELEGSIPVIYPIKAGGVGTTDPDSEMVRNAELQFEYHNVQLLISDYKSGIEAYKRYHRMKTDANDYAIYQPYRKTNDLVGQVQNLKKSISLSGVVTEKRISSKIQRDSWSALKYALRFAQLLERSNLQQSHRESEWEKEYKKIGLGTNAGYSTAKMRGGVGRTGGRLF